MPFLFTCPHCGLETNVAERFAGQTGLCAGCNKSITVSKPAESLQPAPQHGLSYLGVIALVVVVLCGVFSVGALGVMKIVMPATQAAQDRARRAICANNLKQIGVAMLAYHDAYRAFPPAYVTDKSGKPTHSWRVLLLPFLQESGRYQKYLFAEPWDGPNNSSLASDMPDIYRCPDDRGSANTPSYAMIVGPGMLSDGPHTTDLSHIRDGASNTILLIETAGAPFNWLTPADLSLASLNLQTANPSGKMIRSNHSGVFVLFCDGTVRALPASVKPGELKALATPSAGDAAPKLPVPK